MVMRDHFALYYNIFKLPTDKAIEITKRHIYWFIERKWAMKDMLKEAMANGDKRRIKTINKAIESLNTKKRLAEHDLLILEGKWH
jgi:hypothetical protein